MPSDYGYANARIRALKGALLDRQAFDALVASSSIEALVQLLARTAYKPDVESALLRYSAAACLGDALRRNLARTIGSLWRFFDDGPRELIGLLVARWDLFNLIAILRGQANGIAAADILSVLVPAGAISEIELRELVKQPTIQASGELMMTWRLPFAAALAEALRLSGDNLVNLEARLHQIRFRDAFMRLGKGINNELVREILESEIDAANLSLVIRIATLRKATDKSVHLLAFDPSQQLIAGGRLPLPLLAELAQATDGEALMGRLAETSWGPALGRHRERFRESGDPVVLERALEEMLALKGIRMFHRDPLTIGIAIGYLSAKITEVASLRLISQGKELGWPVDEIRAELFWLGRE